MNLFPNKCNFRYAYISQCNWICNHYLLAANFNRRVLITQFLVIPNAMDDLCDLLELSTDSCSLLPSFFVCCDSSWLTSWIMEGREISIQADFQGKLGFSHSDKACDEEGLLGFFDWRRGRCKRLKIQVRIWLCPFPLSLVCNLANINRLINVLEVNWRNDNCWWLIGVCNFVYPLSENALFIAKYRWAKGLLENYNQIYRDLCISIEIIKFSLANYHDWGLKTRVQRTMLKGKANYLRFMNSHEFTNPNEILGFWAYVILGVGNDSVFFGFQKVVLVNGRLMVWLIKLRCCKNGTKIILRQAWRSLKVNKGNLPPFSLIMGVCLSSFGKIRGCGFVSSKILINEVHGMEL